MGKCADQMRVEAKVQLMAALLIRVVQCSLIRLKTEEDLFDA